eukprot:3388720-Rhodomonas_salina.1
MESLDTEASTLDSILNAAEDWLLNKMIDEAVEEAAALIWMKDAAQEEVHATLDVLVVLRQQVHHMLQAWWTILQES